MLNQIKSNSFMGWAVIFTALFLTPNSYYVYHSFCVFPSPYREIASAGVAAIIVWSIVIYTLRKNFIMAKYYCYFEISISAYYYINTIGLDWGLIPALGFTLILPISEYFYSREFDKGEYRDPYENIEELHKTIEYNQSLASEAWGEVDKLKEQLTEQMQEIEGLHAQNNELILSNAELKDVVAHYEQGASVDELKNQIALRDERIKELEGYCVNHIVERDRQQEVINDLKIQLNQRATVAIPNLEPIPVIVKPQAPISKTRNTVKPEKKAKADTIKSGSKQKRSE